MPAIPRKMAIAAALLAFVSPATADPLPALYFCAAHPDQCAVSRDAQIPADGHAYAILSTVNEWINRRIAPREDRMDVWSLNPAAGDCEDYALTKRAELMRAGFPAGALRIGLGRVGSESHAVLLVSTSAGRLVLDNLTGEILPLDQSHFQLKSTW